MGNKIQRIYVGTSLVRPTGGGVVGDGSGYFNEVNRNAYQNLVNSVGSVQFQDSGRRFRFQGFGCYCGNRVAVDVNGSTFRKINLDTLTVTSSKSTSVSGKIWYFGDNRILTRKGIMDFDGNMVTTFSTTFSQITPGNKNGVVYANDSSRKLYKGVVNGDSITFTQIGTVSGSQDIGYMGCGHLGAYSYGYSASSSGYWAIINPDTDVVTNVSISGTERTARCVSGADGKLYRHLIRNLGWGKLQKMGTSNEGDVGTSTSTGYGSYGWRFGKFLGNIVTGGMNTTNGTGNGYGSNNYFIATDGTPTLVQSNAWAYDSNIEGDKGFIDENGCIYPITSNGGSGVILETDKTFTDLDWKNPYLYR